MTEQKAQKRMFSVMQEERGGAAWSAREKERSFIFASYSTMNPKR